MGHFMLNERHVGMHPMTEQLRAAGFNKFLENEQVPYELRSGSQL